MLRWPLYLISSARSTLAQSTSHVPNVCLLFVCSALGDATAGDGPDPPYPQNRLPSSALRCLANFLWERWIHTRVPIKKKAFANLSGKIEFVVNRWR